MTIDEAKTKQCPVCTTTCECCADQCMAWKSDGGEYGFCGMVISNAIQDLVKQMEMYSMYSSQ